MTAVVTRSKQSCSDNQKLLTRSRDLIHVSRRALNPSWTITGASVDYASLHPTPDDPWTMQLAIRQRLARGSLFPAPKRVWARPGTGRICVVCNIDISAHDLENEMILGPVTIWAHMQCYMIWREESCLTNGDRPFRFPRLSTYEDS